MSIKGWNKKNKLTSISEAFSPLQDRLRVWALSLPVFFILGHVRLHTTMHYLLTKSPLHVINYKKSNKMLNKNLKQKKWVCLLCKPWHGSRHTNGPPKVEKSENISCGKENTFWNFSMLLVAHVLAVALKSRNALYDWETQLNISHLHLFLLGLPKFREVKILLNPHSGVPAGQLHPILKLS